MPLDPRELSPQESQVQTSRKGNVVFPPIKDLELQKKFQSELWRRVFGQSKVVWLALDKEKTKEDDELYHESFPQRYKAPVEIPAFVKINPSKQELKKYGIDETKEVLLLLSTIVLEEQGLTDGSLRIGDKVVWDGVEYEIMTFHREEPWANTNVYFHVACTLQRFRQGE